VPALEGAFADGLIGEGDRVVLVLSGSGFRETFVSQARRPATASRTSFDALAEALGAALAARVA
jgi:hypothetical protein